eukprot:CAMPEP_0197655374 /NCGR_PEP_ID=MMETSP1338-20131121/39413_1 /TAXON_ID=43686 ORGANISM="Pelagodinium beii, Strain RCC1491" /NCGR_SAMPLE_ID=MMETSP1338 /ASSEMBLY_ACC=CAM_ASM_000754 /LENGTH=918 /DNA_ID=CAMNT_0043231009 /DNA_START=31 /DNA_END=2787 /DNA_ORIENTATION=+
MFKVAALLLLCAADSLETCSGGGSCVESVTSDRILLQTAASPTKIALSEETISTTPEIERKPEEVQSVNMSECQLDDFARPDLCPELCPYAAEMKAEFCHFRCVKKEECGLLGTVENATIPDEKLMVCRHCEVEGCKKCVPATPGAEGEKYETCEVCMPGYSLTEEGECAMDGLGVFIAIGVVSAILTVLIIAWYVSVRNKTRVNPDGVEHGLRCRDAMRLSAPGGSDPYPLNTNMMTANVAGPGVMAFFRYQGALITWASVLLAVWLGIVFATSTDLLVLGTLSAESPQLLCAVIRWGHNRQMELIWTKVTWLTFAYVFSFVGAIVYGIHTSKMFANVHSDYPTMPSFVAKLDGLPTFSGRDPVEEKLKASVKAATGIDPVGVSVAWDYSAKQQEVSHLIEAEIEDATGESHVAGEAPEPGCLGKFEETITGKVLNAWHVHLDSHHHMNAQEIKTMLTNMQTAHSAYVVFPSQEARSQALAAAAGGVNVDGTVCKLLPSSYAPEGLFWQNMHVTPEMRRSSYAMSTLNLLLSCCAWTVLLYMPYAMYMSSFSYANGDEPGEFSEGLFIGLVVGSQFGLFAVSSMGAKKCAFHSEDEMQKCYTVFYNSALILNLVMDIGLQTYLSYLQMVGVGAHVADGRLLGSLDSLQEIFESYPVQKSVGKLLFTYCWPCTFLVPFLGEPFGMQWLPWHMGQILVGNDKRIQGENAEKSLELGEMEQGRYADCLFNMVLVCCIPFISPGYLAMTFGALIISHVYLYVYDQCKILRYVRKFNFSGPEVHYLGMQLFAIPCAILAAALVFKANQMSADAEVLGSGYLQGYQVGAACFGAMLVHFIIHLTVLDYVVKPYEMSGKAGNHTYAEAARTQAATFFSTNPIHCLRSKYVLNHSPPQFPYAAGKEKLMKTNPQIGAFYVAEKSM